MVNEKSQNVTKIIKIKLHIYTQKVRTRERKREKQNKCAYLYNVYRLRYGCVFVHYCENGWLLHMQKEKAQRYFFAFLFVLML